MSIEVEKITKEMEAFREELLSISQELTAAIKEQTIAKHSKTRDYTRGMEGVEVDQLVLALTISVSLTVSQSVSFTTNQIIYNSCAYQYHPNIVTNESVISDGSINKLIWEFVESRIDFSKYPNCTQPKFTATHEII